MGEQSAGLADPANVGGPAETLPAGAVGSSALAGHLHAGQPGNRLVRTLPISQLSEHN